MVVYVLGRGNERETCGTPGVPKDGRSVKRSCELYESWTERSPSSSKRLLVKNLHTIV